MGTDPHADARKAWHSSAAGAALVAGAFTVAVTAVLVRNYSRDNASNPLDSQRLIALREELRERPRDGALKKEIRGLDLELRERFFRRQGLAGTGGYVLLGGVIVFLAALKLLAELRKKPPDPGRATALWGEEPRAAGRARWAVGALGAALGSLGLVLAVSSGSVPTGERRPAASWPSPEEIVKNWPRFRGPGGLGISACDSAPTSWNGETGETILWKAKVPMKGASSPVVWGGRVFLTGACKVGLRANAFTQKNEIYCFDADSGGLLWRKLVRDVPRGGLAPPEVWNDKTYAASTPVTDGRRVCAVFANGDLVCFDLEGKQTWARGLGPIENGYGHASSLVMYRNILLLQLDQEETEDGAARSKIMALEAASGRTVWEKSRPVSQSWTTPIVISAAGREQVVTASVPWVIAYDPGSGEEVWRAECLEGDVVPSPIYAKGLVFATVEGAVLAAIRPDGRGEVTRTHVAWTAEGELPSICSPVSDGKLVFLLNSGGIMTSWDAETGRMIWEKDLEVSVVSSPTLVGNRIYVIGDEGEGVIVRASSEYEEIARTRLNESCQASPAFSGGRIYIRGEEHLFCIGEK